MLLMNGVLVFAVEEEISFCIIGIFLLATFEIAMQLGTVYVLEHFHSTLSTKDFSLAFSLLVFN